MSSVGSPKSWPQYDSYTDCSQGICSSSCPKGCYFLHRPPPFPDDDSGSKFSPLIIAIISILASAFLLVIYYITSKYCRRRRGIQNPPVSELETNHNQMNHDQWQVASSTGLDEALIKSIAVYKYKKGDGLVEGTECAVCLSEFQEDESLRLLPECIHAFHLPCIDTWLKSHSNCPICRTDTVTRSPLPLPPQSIGSSSNLNVSSLEIQHPNDLVLVVDDQERVDCREEVVVSLVSDVSPKNIVGVSGSY